jgi:mono/diheme cytochrome c family protein
VSRKREWRGWFDRTQHVLRGRCSHRWLCAGLLLTGLGFTGCRGQDASQARVPESTERVYELHCLGCHGVRGEGPWGPNIQGLKGTVTDIAAVIANGQGKMPAFKGHLSEEQIAALAEYVKAFKLETKSSPSRP